MPGNVGPIVCQARVGLLFLRDCGRPALADCRFCGRPVCDEHQVLSFEGVSCPECAAAREDLDRLPTGGKQAKDRRRYYEENEYYPYYFGTSRYFSDGDYRTFDNPPPGQAVAGARPGFAREDAGAGDEELTSQGDFAGLDADDVDDLDGPLES